MHAEARRFVASITANLKRLPTRVLEIGGRNINGTVKDLFGDAQYHAIDLYPGPGVDQVADFLDPTFTPPFEPDAIVCCEVLEHCRGAEQMVQKAIRLLPPGGIFIATAASLHRTPHSGHDGGALRPNEWYANIDPDLLKTWMRFAGRRLEMCRVAENIASCDVYAIAIVQDADENPVH